MAPQTYETSGGPAACSCRTARTASERNRVPEQRALESPPLTFEAVGPRPARRATEVEPLEAVRAGGANGLPVQKHVGTEREILFRAGRPRNREDVCEGERNQAADRRLPFSHERDARPVSEGVERRAEELSTVHGRAEVSHAGREEPVERVESLGPAELDRETGPFSLPHLVAHAAIEL